MSSGDRAKPTSYEERNPFDISKRSEKDVAAEIAQRLAAWKQARGRSYATPPAPAGEGKQTPLGAPVQPTRLPKFTEPVARAQQPANAPRPGRIDRPKRANPQESAAARTSSRAPLFATASVIRRAMPPAPSPKRAAVPPEAQFQTLSLEPLDAAAAVPPSETFAVAPSRAEIPEATSDTAETRNSDAELAPSFGATAEIVATAVEENSPDAPASETPVDEAQEVRGADVPLIAEVIERRSREAEGSNNETRALSSLAAQPIGSAIAELREDPALAHDAADEEAPTVRSHEVLDVDASVAEEPHSSAPPPPDAPDESPDQAPATIEEPIAMPPAAVPAIPPIEAFDDERRDTESPNVATSGFEYPVEETPPAERAALANEPIEAPVSEDRPSETPGIEPTSEPVGGRELVARKSDIEIAPLAAPRTEAPDWEPRIATRKIELPSIQTLIESRRIDTLRADPVIAGRRPIFPHIDQEAWDIPPPIAAHQIARSRGGTGWAIGLGALLLIVGLTAPAAIWQGRQQAPVDQVVALVPAPEPPAKAEMPANSNAPVQMQPAAPVPQAAAVPPPSAPASVQAQLAPSLPAQPEVNEPAPEEQAALSAVGNGGELARAPIIAPPPEGPAATAPASKPVAKSPANKAGAQPKVAAVEAPAFQPVAHPFIPEPGPTPAPFQPAAGSASVPINGTAPSSVVLKPNLIAQLKPKAAVVSAPRPANNAPQKTVQKPRAQNSRDLDQMFQTLIDTLSQGQPVNPTNKPIPPSTRK